MTTASTAHWNSVEDFLRSEAIALDDQDWDTWLALYSEDCEYWVPAWCSDGQLLSDPQAGISLIYYRDHIGLEGRVYRLRTEKASSAKILPRTTHMFQLMSISGDADNLTARTHWTAHATTDDQVATYFGHAHYQLTKQSQGWIITKKKTIVQNDMIHQVLDFYNI